MYNRGVTRYARNTSAVFSLKFHLVWCPKYRRPVLTEVVAERLKALLLEKADELSLTIHTMEIMPDHVHLFLECDPTFSVSEITNRLKRLHQPYLETGISTVAQSPPYALVQELLRRQRWSR